MIAPDTLQLLCSYPAPSVQPEVIGAPLCFRMIADFGKMASLRLEFDCPRNQSLPGHPGGLSCHSFLLRGRRNHGISSGIALIPFFTLFALRTEGRREQEDLRSTPQALGRQHQQSSSKASASYSPPRWRLFAVDPARQLFCRYPRAVLHELEDAHRPKGDRPPAAAPDDAVQGFSAPDLSYSERWNHVRIRVA